MTHKLLYLLAILSAAQAHSECFTQRTSSVRFSAKSTVNELGERIVLVEGLGEGRESGDVGVSVEHWTANCHDLQVVGLQLNVTGPTTGLETPPVTEIRRTTAALPNSTPIPALNCRDDYEQVPGVGCYKFGNSNLNWNEARRYCEAENAHLAVPETKEEFLELRNRMSIRHSVEPWVGIYKDSGSWTTVKGGHSFRMWATGQPRGYGDCLGLACVGLKDYKCSDRGSFICEQNLG